MKLSLFIVIGALFCATVKSSERSSLIRELMKKNGSDFVQAFQCMVDVVGTVSNANGFSELWSQSEPVAKYHLEKWLMCPQAGDKLAVVLCNIREGLLTIQVLNEYFQLVFAQNPKVSKPIAVEYYKRCASFELVDDFLPEYLNEKEIIVNDMI
uniref:Small secreted gut protein n=1 Tax=Mayetiola destructor TaxID=39758 RepID=A4K7P2_MAYDE|nr:small secreted gut protein [Mayetiola destructor]